MSSGSDNVTQVDLSYLHKLKTRLSAMQTQVEDQLRGQGASNDPTTTLEIGPVDSTLTVRAGGVGTSAGSTFDIATALTSALSTMGGSVHAQLAWLDTTLGDMITEITATVNSFGTTEGANNDAMDKLISEFQTTIGAIKKDPSLAGLPGLSS
jgi:phage-related tail protein